MVRKLIQISAGLLQNSYLNGFFTGRLYRGKLKSFCVPGLNCYSCPGALGACPIGSMQALSTNPKLTVSLYVYGFIVFIGVLTGRFVCGFLCPFGLVQELLFKIPLVKFRERKVFRMLNKLKYAVLIVLVIGIPTVLTLGGGVGFPAFCQWLCPAGTLEAGIPLVLFNSHIRDAAGVLFVWKAAVLLLLILVSTKLFRPFCRFLCPLGAFYSLFNRISVIHIHTDKKTCKGCNECLCCCPMSAGGTDSTECIRCGKCVKNCPDKAMSWRGVRKNTESSATVGYSKAE